MTRKREVWLSPSRPSLGNGICSSSQQLLSRFGPRLTSIQSHTRD